MRLLLQISLLITLVLVSARKPLAAEDESSRGETSWSSTVPAFKTFALVQDRNIFDPNRRKPTPVVRRPPREERPPERQEPEPERISLLGVLVNRTSDTTEAVAFFDGSNADYRKSVTAGEMIADCRITMVRTDFVKLAGNGQNITLPVGAGLMKKGEGTWEITYETPSESRREQEEPDSRGRRASDRRRNSSRDRTERDRGDFSASEGNDGGDSSSDDILQILMERRRKEMGE